MAHTFEELKKKTVAELRGIAGGIQHEAVKGYTQLNKEHLLKAICTALNIDMHQHHHVIGVNKTRIKGKIKAFKRIRDESEVQKKKDVHKRSLRMIHHLKRELHKATI